VGRQRENRSGGGVKQAALFDVVAGLRPAKRWLLHGALAILLLTGPAKGQTFPEADEILATVRLRQAQQQIDLQGQLRQDATIVPFHLVQEGPIVRYIFTNPNETLQLKLGPNSARLDDITRSGSTKIAGARLDDAVRGTAITYEDLALKFLYWPNARVLGADYIRTRNCWKMQLRAPANDSQYGSILLWVEKDSGALMRMEAFDRAGKLVKRFEVVSAQKIEGRWFLKQMRVEAIDAQSNRVAARTYLEIKG
jgi:Outer membrane lipoprotein-sorting protein